MIRLTNVLIIKTKNWVFKAPLTIGSFRELRLEIKCLRTAINDEFFKKHTPRFKSLYFILITEKLRGFDVLTQAGRKIIIVSYFLEAFKNSGEWNTVKLKEIVELKAIRRYYKDKRLDKLLELPVKESTSHGDFHNDNIFTRNQRDVSLIDWNRYGVASRYFDLLDYYIINQGGAWIDIWKQNTEIKTICGIDISDHYIPYAIWKVGKELKLFKMRGKLNEVKIKKYIDFLDYLII